MIVEPFLVIKADFEAFLEAVNAKYTHEPTYNNCRYMGHFTLSTGVEVRFELATLDVKPNGKTFYGRRDRWTHVRLDRWIWENISMTGKGSKSDESRDEVKSIMALLGEFEG